ncbi:tRNA lysidine(34) synthetase TilS [Methylonatrum kenyense]|uniref:tRNA lysidine(34) synthetase TilS n=1 Tax=Methylonatrum kenyense TaxID=455253 RepID=UPI0020C0F6C5|nr:tRNA lysidine(34) synthetase TilS [Methylonatrum kenyense]MCK8516395.1 tRNA lysidine(34) synthetase TilS [Methylonatrum kenyense]
MSALRPESLLHRLPDARRYLVAFSGGCDSLVLLHLMRALRPRLSATLQAAHVNHGLHPDASRWAAHCRAVCNAWDIPLISHTLNLDPGSNLEARAREARYAALAADLDRETVLLTAHHADDQAETVLLRVLRGSGVSGLGGIRRQRGLGEGRLARPLLDWRRGELQHYAGIHCPHWLDDPANQDLMRDRNFLRHRIMPPLRERWTAVERGLVQLADDAAETDQLLAELARLDGLKGAASMPLERIQSLPEHRARNLLRHWIRDQGLPLPGRRRLVSGLQALCSAATDRAPELVWPGGRIRRHRHQLYLDRGGPPPAVPDVVKLAGAEERQLSCGRLRWQAGGFLAADVLDTGDVQLRFGALHTRLVPLGRPAKRLGRLLQEAGVPPWQRHAWPVLRTPEVVLAVPGICVCESPAVTDSPSGLMPLWEPDPGL